MNQPRFGSDPVSPNTKYVQADPSTFRAVVQKHTGAPEDPSFPRLPITIPPRFSTDLGPRRPTTAFKLHERRHAVKKLELNLAAAARTHRCGDQTAVMASPVSTLDFFARGSPRTPRQHGDEEEGRAIAEKGFYLYPSPVSSARPGSGSGSEPPELLVLFPLHSPRDSSDPNTLA